MSDSIETRSLPIGSILAASNTVAIKCYDRYHDEDYWMPAGGYPFPLSDQAMQERVEKDPTYRVLRVGSGEEG